MAGHTVEAGLGNGMGKHGPGSAIRVVGGAESVHVDELWMKMEHQRGFRLIGMEVGGIGGVFSPDGIIELKCMDQSDLQFSEIRQSQLIHRDPRRRIVAEVGVDQ